MSSSASGNLKLDLSVSEFSSSSRVHGGFPLVLGSSLLPWSLGLSQLPFYRRVKKTWSSVSTSSFVAFGSLSVVAVSYATYAAYSYAAANSSGKEEEEEEHEAPPPSSPVLNTHTSLEHELERLRERNQVLENTLAALAPANIIGTETETETPHHPIVDSPYTVATESESPDNDNFVTAPRASHTFRFEDDDEVVVQHHYNQNQNKVVKTQTPQSGVLSVRERLALYNQEVKAHAGKDASANTHVLSKQTTIETVDDYDDDEETASLPPLEVPTPTPAPASSATPTGQRATRAVSWMKELKKGGRKPRVALKDVCTNSSS